MSAGSVTIALATATSRTALAGTRFDDRADQRLGPGTARSRLNAYGIRDAQVTQDSAQNSCRAAEMNGRGVAEFWPSGELKRSATPPAPTPALSGAPFRLGTAKTTANSRM